MILSHDLCSFKSYYPPNLAAEKSVGDLRSREGSSRDKLGPLPRPVGSGPAQDFWQ